MAKTRTQKPTGPRPPFLVDLDLPPTDLFVCFANTAEPREENPRFPRTKLGVVTEPLIGFDRIISWMQAMGGLTREEQQAIQQVSDTFPPDAIAECQELLKLRSFCLKLANLRADRQWPSADDYAFLSREVASFAPPWTFVADLGGSWTMPRTTPRNADDLRRPYRQLIFSIVHLLSTRDRDRVKRCGLCGVLFLDRGQARNQKWCGRACGDKAKNENRPPQPK